MARTVVTYWSCGTNSARCAKALPGAKVVEQHAALLFHHRTSPHDDAQRVLVVPGGVDDLPLLKGLQLRIGLQQVQGLRLLDPFKQHAADCLLAGLHHRVHRPSPFVCPGKLFRLEQFCAIIITQDSKSVNSI